MEQTARLPVNRFIEKTHLCHLPTPLEQLPRLSKQLGGPTIWIKRDDCTGLAMGGNKARKLEYVIQDALSCGADTLVTIGAIQSNHVRQTVASAARVGLECRAVLGEWVDYRTASYMHSGNRLLDDLLGLKVYPGYDDRPPEDQLEQLVELTRVEGRKPYLVELGASTPLGALGYAQCADEIIAQSEAQGFDVRAVFHATGSGGTQAGLLAGFRARNSSAKVHGVSVYNENTEQLKDIVYDIYVGTLKLLAVRGEAHMDDVLIDDNYLGKAYGKPTEGMLEALQLLAKTEGIVLDPVYTGKAMAALLDRVRQGEFSRSDNIVFIHTGGVPGLFAYSDIIAQGDAHSIRRELS